MRGAGITSSPATASFILLAFEREPFDDGFFAEALAQAIHRLFGAGAAPVDEIGEIRAVRLAQAGESDADEPKHRAVGLAPEQIAPDGEDPRRELGWMSERLRPRANAEIGAFELE